MIALMGTWYTESIFSLYIKSSQRIYYFVQFTRICTALFVFLFCHDIVNGSSTRI